MGETAQQITRRGKTRHRLRFIMHETGAAERNVAKSLRIGLGTLRIVLRGGLAMDERKMAIMENAFHRWKCDFVVDDREFHDILAEECAIAEADRDAIAAIVA